MVVRSWMGYPYSLRRIEPSDTADTSPGGVMVMRQVVAAVSNDEATVHSPDAAGITKLRGMVKLAGLLLILAHACGERPTASVLIWIVDWMKSV